MEAFNQQVFLWINASAKAPIVLINSARFLAEWPLIIAAVLVLLALVRHRRRAFLIAIRVGTTLFLTLSIAYTFRYSFDHARPFVMGLGRTLTDHAATSSFPSIHLSLMLATGFSLLLMTATRMIGAIIVCLSLAVAWARVYLGVHFPFDMLGAGIISAVSALVVKRVLHEKYLS